METEKRKPTFINTFWPWIVGIILWKPIVVVLAVIGSLLISAQSDEAIKVIVDTSNVLGVVIVYFGVRWYLRRKNIEAI